MMDSKSLDFHKEVDGGIRNTFSNRFIFDDPVKEKIMDENKPALQQVVIENVTVHNCVHCGLTHKGLDVSPLPNNVEGYTHHAFCAFSNKPIYIKFLSN